MRLGADLIALKDDIHTRWFDLQRLKRTNHDYAFLEKPLYESILDLGRQAVDKLKEGNPDSLWIEQIEEAIFNVERKSWIADETFIGPKPYYVMTPERCQEVLTKDINRLANFIHRAGMNLIQRTGEYCGCEITVDDLRSISTGVLRYCEGTLRLGHKRGVVLGNGDIVEHRPGAATTHSNTINFEPTEKGYDLNISYYESGDCNWRERQKGVVDFIQEKGGQCKLRELAADCVMKDASEDDILDLALIISQLKDIDLMSEECVPIAFEEIKKQKDMLKQIRPREDIWREDWDISSYIDRVKECEYGAYAKTSPFEEPGRDREGEQERRLERIAARLGGDIQFWNNEVLWAISQAEKMPCTYAPYKSLECSSEFPELMRRACARIESETNEPWEWCSTLPHRRDEELIDASKDLVDRCPPEPIILGLETQIFYGELPYEIYQIQDICRLAENEHCLDIIDQVKARSKAGVTVQKLSLASKEA